MKNIDERGRVPYQVTGSCTTTDISGSCDIVFPTVPAGKRVVVEYVSAEVTSSLQPPALAVYQDIAGGANHTLPVYSRFFHNYGSNQAVLPGFTGDSWKV